MSHSTSTPHYNLPQFASTDKPAWLTDINTAYSDIDTGLHNAKTAADDAQADASQALETAGDASAAATAADSKGSGAVASIAPAFDTTAAYSVGDNVVYNNLLYTCIVPVVNPGPWSGSANWQRTTLNAIAGKIADNVSNLKIQDLTNVTLTTSDNNKLLHASVSGSDIEIEAVNDPMTFSTTEKVVGKWIDGKPVYQRTISRNVANNEVLLTGVDTLISVTGSGTMPGSVIRTLPFVEYDGTYAYIVTFRLASGNVSVQATNHGDASNSTINATFLYTKV